MSRKDSRGLFSNVLGQQNRPDAAQPQASPSPHLRKVAAGIRQLQEREEVLDRILKEGDRIVELDAADIAPSVIQDRMDGAYDEAAIGELIESMRERGQIVPGLVRPTAEGQHRYQIVFGRRRLAAARQLGLPFRAVVKELSDEQAIIYQGEENTNRDDLSFLEKCLFAQAQEAAGFRRDVICASLATGKSHLSEMLRITATVPRDVLTLIGRAPDTGRRRWLDFAESFAARKDARAVVEAALGAKRVEPGERFALALAALKKAPEPQPQAAPRRQVHAGGQLLATIQHGRAGSKMNFAKEVPQGFVDYLTERMPELHADYVKRRTEG